MRIYRLLFISLLSVFGHHSFSTTPQQFGNDIIAHYEFGKYDQNSVSDVAFNGWIYLATANTAYMNTWGTEINLSVSKDGGQTWQILTQVESGDTNSAAVRDIEVTGNDTSNIKVYVSYYYYSNTPYPIGFVKSVDGLTGQILPHAFEIGDGNYPVWYVYFATDQKHIGTGSLGNSIGIIYATEGEGSTNTDSIVCLISNDTGSTSYSYNLIDTSSSLRLTHPSISYGYSPTSNMGKFFIAYRKGTHISYCKNISSMISGFTNPINIDSVTGADQTSYPMIVCQNSAADNDSLGLSTLVYTLGIDSSGVKLNIFYNMNSSISDYWNHTVITSIQPSNFMFVQGAICFSEFNNNFYLTGYDQSTSSLFVIYENFNFSNSTNWPVLSLRYNDSSFVSNHFTGSTITTFSNHIYTFWEYKSIFQQFDQTLFDMEQIPLNTNIINCPELDDCIVYPNPSNEIIFINLSEKLKFHSARISISDYSGRIVFDEEFIPNLNKIAMNVSQFLPGVYLMTISINTGIMIKRKIIIEN